MSHYLYLQCASHQPPIKSDDYVTSQLDLLNLVATYLEDRTSVLADYIKMIDKCEIDPIKHELMMGRIRCRTGRFLSRHPDCKIEVIDEYGKIQYKGD